MHKYNTTESVSRWDPHYATSWIELKHLLTTESRHHTVKTYASTVTG